jgi:hypothetical protein
MSFLDDIRLRLTEKHPELAFKVSGNTLIVKAPVANGFDVWVSDAEDIVVGYDGWHEHFDPDQEVEAARRCFAIGFSDQVRLKVSLRGTSAYKWTVEVLDNGEWVEDSTTGTVPWAFWLPRRIEYRQNAIFRKDG